MADHGPAENWPFRFKGAVSRPKLEGYFAKP